MARSRASEWIVRQRGFDPKRTEVLGSKLLIGNGYLGYRGTLEEYGKEQLVACTLSGIYDRRGEAWREPVNAPNGLLVRLYDGKQLLSPLAKQPKQHAQSLDIRHGIHTRETVFRLASGAEVTIRAERFASMANPHLICLRYHITASRSCVLAVETGIDGDVWDINGPHLHRLDAEHRAGALVLSARTNEGKRLHICETVAGLPATSRVMRSHKALLRRVRLGLEPGAPIQFDKFVTVFTSHDRGGRSSAAAERLARQAARAGYDAARAATVAAWNARWTNSDVVIEGDPQAQLALRYSIYHLLSIAPSHSAKTSIPARGLSGQVYKGAIFWDTEMFMLPLFNATQPDLAENLVSYRVHTLPGARRKARALGYRGAFYAWESQETGDEACTLFNITDVITGRPLRTYFADKQVHITSDVAHALWQHYLASGDERVLLEGGAETIFECARFFLSWCYFSPDRQRYEILDVTGPDEYHERVHNNAYTSAMARQTIRVALAAADLLRTRHAGAYRKLVKNLRFAADLKQLRDLEPHLYVPSPDPKTQIIEQFDGYHRLEDVSIKQLKARLLDPREYLGGGQGIATTTQVIKQADVLTVLHVLGHEYSQEVKRANWEFYEPRTEHGSSLSACIYALVAAAIGKTEWAYRYFLDTATIDLRGDAKQYVGTLYIGGTHPAANGGAWMAAVEGFGGLGRDGDRLVLQPALPKSWQSLSFRVVHRGQWLSVRVTKRRIQLAADATNTAPLKVRVKGKNRTVGPGARVALT